MERNTGRAASEWLGITDEAVALDLELAVTYRLLKFDNQVADANARRIANEVGRLFGGSGDDPAERPGRVTTI